MTPEEIGKLNKSMSLDYYTHLKTGKKYRVVAVVMDCTNERDGRAVVVYGYPATIFECAFSRDYEEFMEKFKPASPGKDL